TKNCPGLLLILAELIIDRPLNAGFQITDIQHALGAYSFNEGHHFAIRRYRRTDRPADTARNALNVTGLPIVAVDYINLAVGIFVILKRAPGIDILAVIDITTLWRDKRLSQILLFVHLFD